MVSFLFQVHYCIIEQWFVVNLSKTIFVYLRCIPIQKKIILLLVQIA